MSPLAEEWGWKWHEREQRLAAARLTMQQKLRWLEEAQRLALQLQAERARRIAKGSRGGGGGDR